MQVAVYDLDAMAQRAENGVIDGSVRSKWATAGGYFVYGLIEEVHSGNVQYSWSTVEADSSISGSDKVLTGE